MQIKYVKEIEIKKVEEEDIISVWWDQIQTFVPPNYRYSTAVYKFCDYLNNSRANNIKDAVNLYEEEMHRMRMENLQAQILQQQRYQTSLAEISAIANVATAFNTASAAASLNSIRDS